MKKNHVYSGSMTTALVAGEIQARGPMPNMSVITTASALYRAERNMFKRGDAVHALLRELRITLIALQQHTATMNTSAVGRAVPPTQ